MPKHTTGLLLVNLGTPESPAPADVRPYLREFLSDPRVLDIPAWKRWLVLNLFILPFRPKATGEAYSQIWSEEGSPLLRHGRELTRKVQERLGGDVRVALAMRYGRPSIPETLERLRAEGIERIVVFPLYPQYSSAATGSSIEHVFRVAGEQWNVPYLQVVPPFYDHPAFLDAFAAIAAPHLAEVRPERVFFSFHGIPERQIRRGDANGTHCLERADCCDSIGRPNQSCYRAQCYATARRLSERLDIEDERRIVCFQSRLGRDPWIRPYTDKLVIEQAQAGVRRAVIFSPAFVADCLETIEELGMRAVESWHEHGGETLRLIPSLNSEDRWADAVCAIASESSNWL